MTALELSFFGSPRITVDGAPLTVDTRKAVALLARLALAGPQRREVLADLLWPESDDAHARGSLRRTLSVLNRALGGRWLVIERTEISLDLDGVDCDVHRFEAAVAAASAHGHGTGTQCADCLALLAGAASLHRGDFLEGFELRDSPQFYDWCYAEAERLRRALAEVLDALVNSLARRGAHEEALGHAEQRLSLDLLHEPTHRRIMLLHAWNGRRGDAVRQYRECVAVLRRELGVAPLDQTTQLHAAIVAGRHSQPPPPSTGEEPQAAAQEQQPSPASRPAAPPRPQQEDGTPLVGRTDVQRLLADTYDAMGDHGHIIAIEGEAGVGKTRMAQWMQAECETRGATSLTVRCHEGESSVAYGAVAEALRSGLGQPQRLEDLSEAWLREAGRLVPELDEAVPGIASAAPLDSPEARRRFLEGLRRTLLAMLQGPSPGLLIIDDVHWIDESSLDVLLYISNRLEATSLCLVLIWRDDTIRGDRRLRRLLSDRDATTHVQLQRLDRAAVAELVGVLDVGVRSPDLVDRLYRETEGLPLFITEYLRALSAGPSTEEWPVPPGVRDLLAERVEDASDAARQVLTAAAVIGRSFDLDTLLHTSGRSEDELVDALDELVSGGFVTEVHGGAAPAYDFRHEKLRELIYDDATLARRRLLHARVADALQRAYRRRDGVPPHAVLAHHLHHAGQETQASVHYVLAGDTARALSAHAEAIGHYRSAIALGHPTTDRLHEAIGDLLTLRGDYAGALTSYETAAAMVTHPSGLARIELAIALVHERRGDWEAAESHIAAGLAVQPDGDGHARAALLVERALVMLRRGELDEARAGAEQALTLATATGAKGTLAQCHNVLGMVNRAAGDPETAVQDLQQSLAAAEALADPTARIAALNNLALASADLGDTSRALELAKTALALCRRQGDRHREAALVNNVADLLRAAGQEEEAHQHVREAVRLFAEVGEPQALEPEIWKLIAW